MTIIWKSIFSWFWKTKLIILYKEYATFFLLYLWAKYEPIWPEFTVQTVIFVLVFLCVNKHGTTNYCFDSKIWPYWLIFRPQVKENEFLIRLKRQTQKILFLQSLGIKMIFSMKLGCKHFSPLPMGKIWAYMNRFYWPDGDFRCKLAC